MPMKSWRWDDITEEDDTRYDRHKDPIGLKYRDDVESLKQSEACIEPTNLQSDTYAKTRQNQVRLWGK